MPKPIEAKLVVTGTLVWRDDKGEIVGTTEFRAPVEELKETSDDDQRSE